MRIAKLRLNILPASAKNARTEIQEYLDASHARRKVFPRAALVGFCAGLLAVAFRFALAGAESLRGSLVAFARQFPTWGWIFPVLFGMFGAVGAVMIMLRFAPEASGSGIPHLKAVLHRFRDLPWRRVLPVKFLGGVLAIGGGLALGREGPTVQMGGAVGNAIADGLKSGQRERQTLIAAGAGAGLAAAFNAPLSGLLFVLEEVQRDFRPIVFGAAFIAAVVADIVARALASQQPVFLIPMYETPPLSALPYFAVLGVLAGLLGVAFNKTLLGTLNLFARIPRRMFMGVVAAVGAAIGLYGWFAPEMIGSGHHISELALSGQVLLPLIPLWFLIRFALTMLSYGTSSPGGIFAPLLVLGSLLGLAVGQGAQMISPAAVPEPAAFAVVGMAAYFTAIVRAPLTGMLLIVEMTGNYEQMLALLVSCFCAYAVAELLKDLPVYEALLERDLMRSGIQHQCREPMVVEFELEPGAPFEGKQVHALGLPQGCILVRAVEDGREFIPTASTQLRAHTKVTAVISPQAENCLPLLYEGFEQTGGG